MWASAPYVLRFALQGLGYVSKIKLGKQHKVMDLQFLPFL